MGPRTKSPIAPCPKCGGTEFKNEGQTGKVTLFRCTNKKCEAAKFIIQPQ